MKVRLIVFACFLSFLTSASHCLAADNIWNGTWKLNAVKSPRTSPTFTMTISPQGGYEINNGNYTYRFFCDGKEYPKIDRITIACAQATTTEMDTTLKENGKVGSRSHSEISADGKTQTETLTRIHEDGTTETKNTVFVRISGSTGFAGSWKSTAAPSQESETMVTSVLGSVLRVEFPLAQQYTEMNLDGSDALTHGRVPAGATMSAKPDGPLRVVTVRKLKGVVVSNGTLMMSPDGRTLVYEWWKPDHPALKGRQVYERQ
jgi:hypothetical protein